MGAYRNRVNIVDGTVSVDDKIVSDSEPTVASSLLLALHGARILLVAPTHVPFGHPALREVRMERLATPL